MVPAPACWASRAPEEEVAGMVTLLAVGVSPALSSLSVLQAVSATEQVLILMKPSLSLLITFFFQEPGLWC